LRKFDGIYEAVPLDWDYYLLIDDDLQLVCGTIDDAFRRAAEEKFWICQPSLSLDSFASWWMTLNSKSFAFREVEFVEIMAPLLSRDAFLTARPHFPRLPIGYGLDVWWSRQAASRGKRLGILDTVVFRHGRAPGTGDIYQGSGKEQAERAMMKFLKEQQLEFEVGHGLLGGKLVSGSSDYRDVAVAALSDLLSQSGGLKVLPACAPVVEQILRKLQERPGRVKPLG
jgi:hypothetical protein